MFSSKQQHHNHQEHHGVKRKRSSSSGESGDIAKRPLTNGVKSHGGRSNNIRPTAKPGAEQKYTGTKSRLTDKTRALQNARSQLPIWSHTAEIRLGLHGSKDVMILVGETGSGKSTQVPQFLLGESWCRGMIGITQPRRVAATTLARRVADEMGSLLGKDSPNSKVGYSVRFDNNTSPNTKIKFLTDGTLLQEMLRDPWLTQYSCIVVDEVHERGVNVDLILGFLRRIVTSDKKGRKGVPLKVVVMSATADTEALWKFFDEGYRQKEQKSKVTEGSKKSKNEQAFEQALSKVNGNAKTDSKGSKNDAEETSSSWSGFSDSDEKEESSSQDKSPKADESQSAKSAETELSSEHITTCYIEGRQHAVEVSYLPEASQDFSEAALKTIFQIHYAEPLPGDILVFLTGQDTVESLEALVNEYAAAMGPEVPRILCLPIFAALPAAAQQAVFQPTPRGTRKVILATNIAETSVTIPGVRHVIDSGLAKVKEFRTALGLDSLLVKPISKSAAIQRKGRAGREAPGKCFRLYTESDYLALDPVNVPEILRADLASSILTMKARGVDDILNFPFLSPPEPLAVRKALLQLHRLGALADNGSITALGTKMAKLPLPPPLSRVLLSAVNTTSSTTPPAEDSALLLSLIDIIACLSVESLFLPLASTDARESATVARATLHRRAGDHLTLMAAIQAYAAESSDRRAWCNTHFVSHRAMKNVMDVRKQLRAQCVSQGLLDQSALAEAETAEQRRASGGEAANSTVSEDAARTPAILKAFLAGFAGNVARLMPDGSYQTVEGRQTVGIHPSSVLFGKKVEAIMFQELVFTTRAYARSVSAVQLDWYAEAVGE